MCKYRYFLLIINVRLIPLLFFNVQKLIKRVRVSELELERSSNRVLSSTVPESVLNSNSCDRVSQIVEITTDHLFVLVKLNSRRFPKVCQ